jgi:hypothetical protein
MTCVAGILVIIEYLNGSDRDCRVAISFIESQCWCEFGSG